MEVTGSSGLCSATATRRFTNKPPIDFGADLFADDLAACLALDTRAVLRRDTSSFNPLLDSLVTARVKPARSLHRPAQKLNCASDSGLGIHVLHNTQGKLVGQETSQVFPAMTQGRLVSYVSPMETIHKRIKRLRTAKGLSMPQLAKAAGYKSWQTVQQWESDDPEVQTAPKRAKIGLVAEALGVSVDELMFGQGETADAASHADKRPEGADVEQARIAAQIDVLKRAVHALAAEFGVSPLDLVSDAPAARNRIADALAHKQAPGEAADEIMSDEYAAADPGYEPPPARPTTQVMEESWAAQADPAGHEPEEDEAVTPVPLRRERRR